MTKDNDSFSETIRKNEENKKRIERERAEKNKRIADEVKRGKKK